MLEIKEFNTTMRNMFNNIKGKKDMLNFKKMGDLGKKINKIN